MTFGLMMRQGLEAYRPARGFRYAVFSAGFFCLFVLLACHPGQARETDGRVALVIGLADYASIPRLRNTTNDARGMSETLTKLGFKVDLVLDKSLPDLRKALAAFSFKAETAELALVYYSGHGIEVKGENYIVPLEASLATSKDLSRSMLSVSAILKAVDKARQLRIVILDSCRDNPFKGQVAALAAQSAVRQQGAGAQTANTPANPKGKMKAWTSDLTQDAVKGMVRTSGLAVPNPQRGTLVAFAAKDGAVALDGTGKNSPYAKALMQHMVEPGVEIGMMFRRVHDTVLALTKNEQKPHVYGALSGIPLFLAGAGGATEIVYSDDKKKAWSALAPDQAAQLEVLSKGGDLRATLGLAYMLLNADDTRYDPKRAFVLLQAAAEKGDAESQYELAKLYEKGIGVGQNTAKALQWYTASAKQKFNDATNDLGFLYYQGGSGIPRNPKKAIALFTEAANQRHPQAMFNVAALIDDGLIKGKNADDAADYLYLALRSGVEDVLDQLIKNPTMFKKPTRRALQKRLAEFDFYKGALDGDIGPGTKKSLKRAFGIEE